MNTRSKLIAALLGLAVATGVVGDVSAKAIAKSPIATKTVKSHAVVTKSTKAIVRKPIRFHIGTPAFGKHVRTVHRAPVLVVRKVAHVTKHPALFQKQAFAHRLVVRKTVIR